VPLVTPSLVETIKIANARDSPSLVLLPL